MSRRTVSSFWNEHASATRPSNCSSANKTTRSAAHVSTSGGSCSVVAKEPLLHRVAPEPEAEGLERDRLVGRDVAEVHARADVLDEPALRGLRRRLEDDIRGANRVGDLADELGAHAARGVENA